MKKLHTMALGSLVLVIAAGMLLFDLEGCEPEESNDTSGGGKIIETPGESNGVRPLELKAYLIKDGIVLTWGKAEVDDLAGYRIEYSYDNGAVQPLTPENNDKNSITTGVLGHITVCVFTKVPETVLGKKSGGDASGLASKTIKFWVVPITGKGERVESGSNAIAPTTIAYGAGYDGTGVFPDASGLELTAGEATADSIPLSWTPVAENNWNGTPGAYDIQINKENPYNYPNRWENLATVAHTQTAYTAENLEPGTKYAFRIIAVNAEGYADTGHPLPSPGGKFPQTAAPAKSKPAVESGKPG